MLTTLQNLLEKTHERITVLKEQETIPTPLVDASLFELHEPGTLDCNLLQDVVKNLKKVKYKAHPTNKNSPQIFLYGTQHYSYNAQSAALVPNPIKPDSIMSKLLDNVNSKLGTSYNSMLVNKYKDLNSELGFHKDDERCLDSASPISTLSLGSASRRFEISLDNNKSCSVKTLLLKPGSLFTMKPGFQENYWHAVAAGDINCKAERGVRYSVTFRRLIPHAPAPVATSTSAALTAPAPAFPPAANTTSASVANDVADTYVFGSSLVKGLDEQLLSKYSKKYSVFCNSGAHVKDIYEDIERVVADDKHDTTKVSTVFLLCGGNDVENFQEMVDIRYLYEDFEDLVWLTREAFPNAKVHIISMIPRRSKYRNHIRYMHKVNRWLKDFCNKEDIRFVDIFSFFIVKTPSFWHLNRKLFNSSELHFSNIGYSVLGKVLIGVANLPR